MWKLKCHNPLSTYKKLNGYKKYSTLSHQPRAAFGDTRDIGKLF